MPRSQYFRLGSKKKRKSVGDRLCNNLQHRLFATTTLIDCESEEHVARGGGRNENEQFKLHKGAVVISGRREWSRERSRERRRERRREANSTVSSRQAPQDPRNLVEQLISDARSMLKLSNKQKSGRRVCENKSLPNQWHEKRLVPYYIRLRLSRHDMLAVFLLEFHLNSFPATKLRALLECRRCGAGTCTLRERSKGIG